MSLVFKRFASRASSGAKYLAPKPTNGPTHTALSDAQKAYLDRVIRVDQAGELGADLIYMGQFAALGHHKELRPVIRHMWDQEIHHHATFDALQTNLRCRPSLLTPAWKVGAFGLGLVGGMMGKEFAMACTEAIETVIGGHYNTQLRVLSNNFGDLKDLETGETTSSAEIRHLEEQIKIFRDQESGHLNTALKHDAQKARPHWLIFEGVKLITKTAVYAAERI
ncbi:DEKNAAC103393 [Brettanomyces naardenensis]|uniref:5-demethoxyubiquinone hydroxylase, mitochondrial n=1 Tax=Brettanomyces naardenensis TaxID=13370 RepID=A0A448YN68_BRENA|nr:DEKNAAC103393 [Brettanomyces naardenensis]